MKRCVNAPSPGHGQQKPQGRAAVVAAKHCLPWDFLRRDDSVAGVGSCDVRAQSVQAAHGRFNVPVGFRAEKSGWRAGKGGADQQTVRLRLRGDGADGSRKFPGKNGDIHIKDLPE